MTAANHPHPATPEKPEAGVKDSPANPPEAAAKTLRRRNFRITVYEAWCKKCGICVAFCPAGALREHETTQQVVGTAAKCIGCRQCEWRCPDFAIIIKPSPAQIADSLTAGNKSEGKE
jgi:2-oxoglutarate ferredoxin oxidoreductase subunit delta